MEVGGNLGWVCYLMDVTTVNKSSEASQGWECGRFPSLGMGKKCAGWGIHVRTVAKSQSFTCPGAALLQNVDGRVWCSHTVYCSIQEGFSTLDFFTTSKRGVELHLLLQVPGGSPGLKLWKGSIFPFFHCYIQIQLLPSPAASFLTGFFCLVLVFACERTMDCTHKILTYPSCHMLMFVSLRAI